MGELKEAKKQYDSIPIPPELSERVSQTIENHGATSCIRSVRQRRRHIFRQSAAAAAAVMVLFTAGLNTSEAFASQVQQMSLIGPIARVLTFRSYEEEAPDLKVQVEIPSIETIQADLSGLAEQVNQQIYALCEAYVTEAKKHAEEYHQAFLATGGTEEEWLQHDLQIRVGYEVKNQTDQYISLIVTGTESWNGAGSSCRYYNLDLETGTVVTLEQLLGADYKAVADEAIKAQIAAHPEVGYWTPENGGFSGITEDAGFYINEAGNPVIVFEKYQIAPGAAGSPEFEIKKD